MITSALSTVDTTTADGRLFFQIIAAVAEFERSLCRTGGNPSVVNEDVLTLARARKEKGESVSAIARALAVFRADPYQHLGE